VDSNNEAQTRTVSKKEVKYTPPREGKTGRKKRIDRRQCGTLSRHREVEQDWSAKGTKQGCGKAKLEGAGRLRKGPGVKEGGNNFVEEHLLAGGRARVWAKGKARSVGVRGERCRKEPMTLEKKPPSRSKQVFLHGVRWPLPPGGTFPKKKNVSKRHMGDGGGNAEGKGTYFS